MIPRIYSDTAACEGRQADHPYYRECATCKRFNRTDSTPPWQSWIRGWGGHGECPDRQPAPLTTPRGSLGEEV